MKKFFLFLFAILIMGGCCNKQQSTTPLTQTSPISQEDITAAVGQFIQAMLTADESILQSILSDDLVFGHSGGKVQNKSEFIAEILSKDPFTYLHIETLDQTIQLAGDAAIVRHIFTAETKNVNDEQGSLRVGNMMVWKVDNGNLRLLARQAYRLQ
jgi:hypothetical protein